MFSRSGRKKERGTVIPADAQSDKWEENSVMVCGEVEGIEGWGVEWSSSSIQMTERPTAAFVCGIDRDTASLTLSKSN